MIFAPYALHAIRCKSETKKKLLGSTLSSLLKSARTKVSALTFAPTARTVKNTSTQTDSVLFALERMPQMPMNSLWQLVTAVIGMI